VRCCYDPGYSAGYPYNTLQCRSPGYNGVPWGTCDTFDAVKYCDAVDICKSYTLNGQPGRLCTAQEVLTWLALCLAVLLRVKHRDLVNIPAGSVVRQLVCTVLDICCDGCRIPVVILL